MSWLQPDMLSDYMGPTGPTPAPQPNQPPSTGPVTTTNNPTTQKPPPSTIPYHQPSFNLHRLTRHLTKDERINVHHNYISAIPNLDLKKDLINRLKQSDPHNIPTYEAEMTHHIALHDDVSGRIHTTLKQDDYFRTLEDLPPIDGLSAYDDIMLFLELFNTAAVVEQITHEGDRIEKQLNRHSMYPLPQTPLLGLSPDQRQCLNLPHTLQHHQHIEA